jgi:TatD DNase family protein
MNYDVHCHLSFPEFDRDRDEIVKRALGNEIGIINSSVSPEEIGKAMEISEKYENVYWTLGLSASEIDENKVENTIKAIRLNKKHLIGIGEVGLDYYWVKDEKKRAVERINFEKFIMLSTSLDLPLVVHSRNAEEDCLKILQEHGKKALMHCFSGTMEQAEKAIKLGCLISIPTNITHSKQKQELASRTPISSIVLETDAPYLSPIPKTRNEPVNIRKSVEAIAELKGIKKEEVEKTTSENARRFFNLD